MKAHKIPVFLFLSGLVPLAAQTNTFPSSGNVGIGTTSPSFILHSRATGGPSIALAIETDQTEAYLSFKASGTSTLSSVRVGALGENLLFLNNGAVERMRIDGNGNVGIGTTNPDSRLAIDASDNTALSIKRTGSPRAYLGDSGSNDGGDLLLYTSTGSLSTMIRGSAASYFNGGNVGIGTTNPTYPLSVNGTIKAKEVIVETIGWSDYVFNDDYRLAPLSEVEAHIREKKHLPGIPSAAEVAEQGISVGDMQAKMMAKIEELTLHLIRIERENAALRQEVEAIKQSVHP
jgi:hypothetical protein